MTKPTYSAGALRAAREILQTLIIFTDKTVPSTELEEAIVGAAQIIHDETRQNAWQELLPIARAGLNSLVLWCEDHENGCDCSDCAINIPKLQAAIKKVEEE